MTHLFRGGTIVDPSQDIDKKADLLVEGGKVVDLGRIEPRKSWETIDCTGLHILPGFIDMHVHLREPGREDKETIASGSRAAVAGGFTSVACMPNTSPVNDSGVVTKFIRDKARQAGLANVFPIGAVTKGQEGKDLAEIGEMVEAGAVAISDDGHPVDDDQLMRRALEYSKIFDVPVIDHCENRRLAAAGCMNEGEVSTSLGLPGLSRAAEEVDVARDIVLSRVTGGRIHIAHISTRESLDWVRQAKRQGIRMTCEVTPHHFTLLDSDIRDYDTNLKMNPPLRESADVAAMKEGLSDGSIDCIATDHAPHTILEKEGTFETAANGVIGLETAIPLACEFLLRKGLISLKRLVEVFSLNPNRILNLNRGTLQVGSIADITILDLNREVTVDVAKFKSKSRNCPFDGWVLRGVPWMTVVSGRIVYRLATE